MVISVLLRKPRCVRGHEDLRRSFFFLNSFSSCLAGCRRFCRLGVWRCVLLLFCHV